MAGYNHDGQHDPHWEGDACGVYRGKAHYVRLSLEHLPALPGAKHVRERFAAHVFAAREDSAQYADILTGVTVRLKEPESVIHRWKETVAELLM